MLCRDIIEMLEKKAPDRLSLSWDNTGLLLGRKDREVKKLLVALDLTDSVAAQAVELSCGMIITHHPPIFHAIKRLNDDTAAGRRFLSLLRNDISCYAMHTNFDIAAGCMAYIAAEKLGLLDTEVLEEECEENGESLGVGRVGRLERPMETAEIAALFKDRFGLPFVTVYREDAAAGPHTSIAISPGSGRSMLKACEKKGVHVLITGDMGHHEALDAADMGIVLIDGGHFGTERIFVPCIKEYLEKETGNTVEILAAEEAFPAKIY